MLILSQRHTAADMALWGELEEADLVHGQRLMGSPKLQRSLDTLRAFAAAGPCHVAFSGGKDSTALLGLVALAELPLPVVWFRAMPKHNPDVPEVVRAVERHFGVTVEVIDYDSPTPVGMTPLQAETIASHNFIAACRAYQRDHGRRILGVRADESHARRMKMNRWGLTTENSCTPLGWWTAADVFGFLAAQDLPVPPVYAMLGGGRWDREHIRVDALAGERGDGSGRLEWEREYYGETLRRLGL